MFWYSLSFLFFTSKIENSDRCQEILRVLLFFCKITHLSLDRQIIMWENCNYHCLRSQWHRKVIASRPSRDRDTSESRFCLIRVTSDKIMKKTGFQTGNPDLIMILAINFSGEQYLQFRCLDDKKGKNYSTCTVENLNAAISNISPHFPL